LYRTQIYDVIGIAEHILTVNFDERLQQGDIGLVGAIRLGHGIGNRDLYSFATKYANWHRPTLFPIYDRLVKRILPRLNNRFHFSDPFTQADLHEYPVLVSTIDSLLTFCDLDVLNYKQLDQGLWLYAKFVYEREHDPLPEGIVQQIQNVENTMD